MRASQQDCSTAPSNCICWPRACSKTSTQSSIALTLGSTATIATTSLAPSTAAETTTLLAPTTVSAVTTNSSAAVESTTLGASAMTDTQSSNGNISLIGGIVGGVVALLLIVGVIAFFVVARNRRNSARPANQNDVALASAHVRASSSHYGKFNAEPVASGYCSSPPSNYDDPSVLANNISSNYVIVSTKPTNSTHYVDPAGVLSDDL